MNIKNRIVKVRHMALKAEVRAMGVASVQESIDFGKIGKELDKILHYLVTEEKKLK